LVSKKLPGIGFVAVELEVRRQASSEFAQACEQVLAAGLSGDGELPWAGQVDFDLIAFLQVQGLNDGGGEADGEAIAPFGDLHGMAFDIR